MRRSALALSWLWLWTAFWAAGPCGPMARAEDSKPADKARPPRGDLTRYTFNHSKIFPGTTRDYWIYVPKQYVPERPACLFVCQDGVQYNAPAVFDELIDRKAMPVTIGVFVAPGVVRAPSDRAMHRYNRSFEYDGLGDNYARFLLEELLPEVEKKTAPDGRAIHLSKKGDDRCIGGASSGAICAFTAAWERPESFRRVFSAIGTYVGLRGGNDYPTLIRKTEPKPLRVFLQDGSSDLNIYGGDWWMANQEMERALRFAGYEIEHDWGTGGHNGQHATRIFPEAMKWLWKDWPKGVKAGAGSQQLQSLLVPGEEWQLVAEGLKFTEGTTANARGEVFFDDIPDGKSYKVGLDGKVSVWLDDSKHANGQAIGPDGRLYAAAEDRVIAYDEHGKGQVIAEGFQGNDLVVNHEGGIYVTNPLFENGAAGKIWYISPSGEKRVVDDRGWNAPAFPNGVALSPDQTLLYVADTRSHWIYSYQVQPDGSLAHKQKFFHLHVPDTAEDAGVDGIKVDREGRVYAATRMGIQVCDQPGRVNAIVPVPHGLVANLCFGGPEFDTIYAACGSRVYKRKVRAQGANAYQAPIKPPTPRL